MSFTPGQVVEVRYSPDHAVRSGTRGEVMGQDGHYIRVRIPNYENGVLFQDDEIELVEENETVTAAPVRWTPLSRPDGIKIGDRVKIINNTDGCAHEGEIGYFLRDDYDGSPFAIFDGSNPHGRLLCYADEIEALPSEDVPANGSDLDKLKAEVWKLFEAMADRHSFCSSGREDVVRELSKLGITPSKKRYRVSYEVEATVAPTELDEAHHAINFKVEEIS